MTERERVKPKKVANVTKLSREEWLEARTKGIGGSDVSTILNLNDWKSPFQLYLEKTGAFKVEQEDNESMYFGRELEDFIAKEFSKRTGLKVKRNNFLLQHPIHTFMLANIDREIIDENGKKGVLEVKTTIEYNKDKWTGDTVPDAYMLQLQHYLYVCNLDYGFLAVLIGGRMYKHYRVDRDDELIDMIIEAERTFWEDHVLKGQPPEIDGSQASKALLGYMFPAEKSDPENTVELDDTALDLLATIEEAEQEEKALKAKKTEAENKLKMMIGNFDRAVCYDYEISFKGQSRTTISTKLIKEKFPDIAAECSETKMTAKSLKIKKAKK